MEVSLEVLLSTSIKRKTPCPRLNWLGQEKEVVFLVDEKNVSEISLRSGRVKKALLKKSNIVTLTTTGAWLAALHVTGELSLWNKDLDCLLTVPSNEEISQLIGVAQENSLKLYLYVSGDGSRVLLATHTGCVYLWENTEQKRNQTGSQKSRVLTGRWSKIEPCDTDVFPVTTDKEATVNAIFVENEVLGDSCLCTFVFFSETRLVMTFLALRWLESSQKYNSVVPYHVHWAQQDCSLDMVTPSCQPVKSRGALLAAFSNNGLFLAMAINQKDPKNTCVLLMNTMKCIAVFGSLRGCSSRDQQIPTRLIRSYWVGDMSWTADSLFLACMLKRGSLLLLTVTGELLTLTTSGCSVEFGPAEFIPLHPLITYRPPVPTMESCDANDSLGSNASETDLLRQRFSVTCHPRLPYLMVSDGYMVTVLRFAHNLSPYSFMKSLLLDSAQRLENVRQNLHLAKPKKNGIKLRSLSSLKDTLIKDQKNPPSVVSTIPSFLQDEEEMCARLERLISQDDAEASDDDGLKFTEPSQRPFGRAEQGRLEFASMFDTIHASDHCMERSDVLRDLLCIQRTLLTAWAIGVTMTNVTETNTLLHYTVGCLTHFLFVLQSPKCPMLTGKPANKTARGSPWAMYITLFQQCLTFLYWDVTPRQAVGHMIKLTSETIKLILVQHHQLYSKSLLESFCLLKTVSQELDAIYTLEFESTSVTSAMGNIAHLDTLKTPVFEAARRPLKVFPVHSVFEEPPKPVIHSPKSEKRLAVLWRILYNQTLWYQTRLRKQISLRHSMQLAPAVENEEKAIGVLLCHIQAELQSSGEHFAPCLHLLPVIGEEYYLLGSYKESIDFWNKELLETTSRGGRRAGILQTRYYLAVLYCYLYNYNLIDALGMCDQLVKEILIRSSLLTETEQEGHRESSSGTNNGHQPFLKIHSEAALAVVQSMGRFMAAYFTNQRLYVFPPHNVHVLAPLHITTDRSPRVVTLQHSIVASMVRDQNLSSVWTVEYALDLLLVGGLILEAAWLANKLGDWKMSVSMAVAYNLHRDNIPEESKGRVAPMPLYLSPAHIFQEKLQSFLGQPPNSETLHTGHTEGKRYTDAIEEEDADVLFSSVQEMLKAAVMANAEILTETLHQLMESAKDLSRNLSGLVPERMYLPAPPLYCPQPSSVSEEDPSDFLLAAEKANRQKLSGVLQRILLLLRAARCSLPAAQWYIKQIKRARKIMQKIRLKGSLPPLKSLPETLLNYASSRTVFPKSGGSADRINNPGSSSVVACFRELCTLCWLLHVREQLSLSCRQYQKARDNGKLFKDGKHDTCQIEYCNAGTYCVGHYSNPKRGGTDRGEQWQRHMSGDKELDPDFINLRAENTCKGFQHGSEQYDSCVTEHCFQALEWACRMLPFTRVTNCEELIQDIILSLISELPPVKKVAEIMVRAFPHPDDVRVPLREKYHSVQQRLRHSMVKGLQGEEMLSVVIHNVQRVRVKTLRRIQKNIGPVEMHVWEPPLDETMENESRCYDKYSLGTTSLSISTLTDLGRPQIYSDTDTLSDALMNTATDERKEWHVPPNTTVHTGKKTKASGGKTRAKSKMPNDSDPSVLKVGTWEFECNDEEYTNFLDLFLSYLLERDLLHSNEPGIPFLTAFSAHLREHELNSLVFDVHTTLKRKMGKPGIKSVFRAGSCFKVNAEHDKPCNDSINMQGTTIQTHGPAELSSALCPAVVIEKPVNSTESYFRNLGSRRPVKSGLFGLQDGRTQKNNEDKHNYSLSSLSAGRTCDQYNYRLIQNKHFVPCEELGAELQAKYSNEVKLVEWMIRWSDRRLFWSTGKAECHVASSTAIRVKTSSAALLTSIWLLEKPYLGSDYISNIPPREYIVAPVFQAVSDAKLQVGSNVGVDHLPSDRGSPSMEHEQDSETEGGSFSIASCKVSRSSCDRSQERQHITANDKPQEDTSVLFEITTLQQTPVPSEMEDDQEDQLDTERSPKISVSIRPVSLQMENISSDSQQSSQRPENTVIQIISDHSQGSEPAVSASVTSLLQQSFSNAASSCPPPAPTTSQPQPVPDGGQITQPGNTSEAFRHLFQDEMFKLLQLQQINFMSIMQVVGSSFAALPTVQHLLQQASHMERDPVLNPPGGHFTPHIVTSAPQGHSSTVSASQTMLVTNTEHAATRNQTSAVTASAVHDQSNKENLQKLPDLNIPSNQVNSGGKIPANLGLLSTTLSQGLPLITPPAVLQTPSLIPPPGLSSLNEMPLLKLHTPPSFLPLRAEHFTRRDDRPPLREAWGPANSGQRTTSSQPSNRVTRLPHYTGVGNTVINTIKRPEDANKWAEPVIIKPSRHSAVDSRTGTHAKKKFLKLKNKREKSEIDLFETPQNNTGIPLLRLHTDQVLYIPTIPAPHLPVPMVSPLSYSRLDLSKVSPQPVLTLLKTDLSKHMQNVHISSTPRLIPLENLIAFERGVGHRGAPGTSEGSVQLLKANIQPFEDVKPGDSIKRQKRRSLQGEGVKKEKKTSVTFRPEDSIIKPNNFDEVVQTETEHNDKKALEEGNDFIIPLGAFESLLSDVIPDPPIPSAAELHYMAATKKKAPEIRDASTNTDSASKPLKEPATECEELQSNRLAGRYHPSAIASSESRKPLTDTGTECEDSSSGHMVSSHLHADMLSDTHHKMPPRLYLNVSFSDEVQHEIPPASQRFKTTPETGERHSSSPDVDSEEFPRLFQDIPSSAELHHMAACVTTVLPPEPFNRREILSVDMLEKPHLPERTAGRAHSVAQHVLFEDLTSAQPNEPISNVQTPRILEDNEPISRLKEMDVQLRALQNMADSMERDFANTKLLVNTIENLTSVVDPDTREIFPSGVAHGPERVLPLSDLALDELVEEEEGFTLPSPQGSPMQVFISAKSDTRPSTAPGPDKTMPNRAGNDLLQMTGLSDIADILSDLMAGGISPAELGLTQTQAETLSRERPRNPAQRTEKEKAELQLWMKRKQRERQAEYRRRLVELREQEHSPFPAPQSANTSISSKTIQQHQRVKDVKDRTLLSEHHTYRVSDALSLMQDMLSEAKRIPTANPRPRTSPAALSKPPGPHSAVKRSPVAGRSLSAGQAEKRRPASKYANPQPRFMSTPAWTQTRGTAKLTPPKSNWEPKMKTRSVPSYSVHRRYDPSLPGDRMSQITRRGMLVGKNRTSVRSKTTNPIIKPTAVQFTSPRQDRTSKGTRPQSRALHLEDTYERDIVSPWEIPDEINRILNSSRNSLLSQGSLVNGDAASRDPVPDNSSDSTGSILSKLDWKAIEDLVGSI